MGSERESFLLAKGSFELNESSGQKGIQRARQHFGNRKAWGFFVSVQLLLMLVYSIMTIWIIRTHAYKGGRTYCRSTTNPDIVSPWLTMKGSPTSRFENWIHPIDISNPLTEPVRRRTFAGSWCIMGWTACTDEYPCHQRRAHQREPRVRCSHRGRGIFELDRDISSTSLHCEYLSNKKHSQLLLKTMLECAPKVDLSRILPRQSYAKRGTAHKVACRWVCSNALL